MKSVKLGLQRHMLPIPPAIWRTQVGGKFDLSFMSADHHRVREWVVLELPRVGAPLTPEAIAAAMDLPRVRVQQILDDLERHMTFLFRNQRGAVVWAYPVTVEPTPHRVTFSSGEQAYAA